ncbi:MAG: B12-binding domain-containing radical SAM protein [Candidatus Eremiobacteraeota bacterium]|nr:B12-binding domain-containing radical SAM protein [Candidatus Eremiobacteraeota bacterium]
MRSRLVLVNTNLTYEVRSNPNQVMNFPMALLIVGRIAENAGFDVGIVDLQDEIRTSRIPLDNNFFDMATELILEEDSDLYGFSCRADAIVTALNLARKVKSARPDSKIMLGGAQATFADMEIMQNLPFIDFIIRGEVENSLPKFLSRIKEDAEISDLPGITYRDGDRIIKTPDAPIPLDLDELPSPAYHLMKRDVEENSVIFMHIGRGCPNNCAFCAAPIFNTNKLRLKSPKKIVEEINELSVLFNTSRFLFGHDHFMAKRSWVLELCHRLKNNKNKITFFSMGHFLNVDEETLKELSLAGCRILQFGLESMSENTQKFINKNLALDRVFPVLQLCSRYNIHGTLSVIVGIPREKEEDLDKTLHFLLRARQIPGCVPEIRLLAPMPGTPIYNRYLKTTDNLRYTGIFPAMLETPAVTLKENLDLIQSFPRIFCNYFTIKPEYLPLSLVLEISRTYQNLVFTFPFSTLVALSDLKWGACRLMRELKKWHRKTTGKKNRYLLLSRGELGEIFPSFLEEMYERKKISFFLTSKFVQAEKRTVIAQVEYLNSIVRTEEKPIRNLFQRESLYGDTGLFCF